jgi:type VII secretion ATPase EccA
LHRETNRIGARLSAPIKAGPYLSISVTEASHAGLALASALIDDRQYEKAEALLGDSALLDTWENHQWKQYIEAYLMFATQRWPDVISVAAAILPPQAIIMSAVTAATCTLAAHAAAHLGQARVALEWTDRVELRSGYGGPTESRRQQLETAVTAIDPNDFPLIAADLAYVRGMAHRQLGDEAKAQVWLSKATINGALIEAAKQALADPALQLVVTDENAIESRTNKWDVTTELSEQQRAEEGHKERRVELLEEGRALLNHQVGLTEVKRAVLELEDQIEVRALRLAAGLPVNNQTNHMLLVGPPGTGKTTTAEALGKIYAGLGIVRHPEIVEVKRSDFCGEHIGASGPKTNELISRSMGRILFMDEFYSLVERHQDGRPDMIGMEAVNQLLVALEVHRFDFCFIGAGYEREVDEFLTVNPGLAGRFVFARRARRDRDSLRQASSHRSRACCRRGAEDRVRGVARLPRARRPAWRRRHAKRAVRPQCGGACRTAARLTGGRPASHRQGLGDRRRPADAAHAGHQRRGERCVRGKACADSALTGVSAKTANRGRGGG